MYKKLDIEHWNRKEHYQFFSGFDEPCFGVTALLDVSRAYLNAKSMDTSFFIFYLHKSLLAIHELPVLKYRIVEGEVLEYDHIHASATINREDGTFGFSFILFDEDYRIFEQNTKTEMERIRQSNTLFPDRNGADVIHFSALPWLRFTSLSHARSFSSNSSVPKISVGKIEDHAGKMDMPCSVHVHHGLADGKDVGDFFALFQELLNK